jgi:hypothetical protein
MSDTADTARAIAEQSACEAKLIAYRKSKDGEVVSLVLHPSDVSDSIRLAQIGQRYMVVLVPLGENEEPTSLSGMPRPVASSTRLNNADMTEMPQPSPVTSTCTPPARAPRQWHEIPYVEQAGILCNDPEFRKFLRAKCPPYILQREDLEPPKWAAHIVRHYCQVDSRTEILPGTEAENRWNLLVSSYRMTHKGAA